MFHSQVYPKWSTLPYYNETELPKGVTPQAGEWPLQYFWRDLGGRFYDLKSNPVYFWVKDPTKIDYDKELQEVVEVQNELNANPTDKRIEIAKFWGTGVPLQQWIPIVLQLISSYKVPPTQSARLLCCVQRGISDAFIICWYYKYLFECPRPCQLDHNLKTILNTPRFPSYLSGHSVVSGLCEVILAHYFPMEAKKLNMLAQDASISRLYGGIHFRSDLEEGLKLGREIGKLVVSYIDEDHDYQCQLVDIIYNDFADAPIMPSYYKD
ncbi:MAG: vanadium-dependent haloperoxidase [Cellulosilyticaceae bacterium]